MTADQSGGNKNKSRTAPNSRYNSEKQTAAGGYKPSRRNRLSQVASTVICAAFRKTGNKSRCLSGENFP